jgi:tRNA nucleotidyltransferase (CCA-adding enzyme)
MNVYLVGGAVRDQLLGRKPRENDYVVVGVTPELMIKKGFKQVGKDFPVFLHPKTNEEYALARTEKKSGTGYHGFTTHFDATITLEQDLIRRDLTINAIAQDENNQIIDPYHGYRDIQDKKLRHVSEAFIEDPLRVLRVARFQAMLPDFSIDPKTMTLMQSICKTAHEIQSLSNERIWLEINKSAELARFDLFWRTLHTSLCLKALKLDVDIEKLTYDIQNSQAEGVLRFVSGLWQQPSHVLQQLLTMQPPNHIKHALTLIITHKETFLNPYEASAEQVMVAIQTLDPYRRAERALNLLSTLPTKQISLWKDLCKQLTDLNYHSIIAKSKPNEIAEHIKAVRIEVIMRSLGIK